MDGYDNNYSYFYSTVRNVFLTSNIF